MFAALMAVAANNGAPLSDDVPRPDVLGTLLTAVSNK